MSDSNGGVHSKFQERLRNIRISRIKRKKMNEKYVLEKVKEIREVVGKEAPRNRVVYIPKGIGETDHEEVRNGKDQGVTQVIVNIKRTAKDREYSLKKVGISREQVLVEKRNLEQDVSFKKDSSSFSEDRQKKGEKLEEEVDTRYQYVSKDQVVDYKKRGVGEEKQKDRREKLELDILDKLKASFEDKLDELEVLESELYILNQKQNEEVELKNVRDIKRKINELVEKINSIIEQYNLYSKSYYMDRILEVDDRILEDDFIEYKDLVDSYQGEKKFVQDYKKLEEFQHLYRQLVLVRGDTQNLTLKNERKIHDFDVRDKKYDSIRLEMVNVDEANRKCSYEIERQNEYFTSLMKNIGHIDREVYTTYHLRGVGELLNQSLRYIGLMMVSPLRGFLPGIAVNAMVTRRMIGNIYRNMHFEEQQHVRYETIDYESEISKRITDVDYTSLLLDDTLRDLERLKEDFMMQYDSRIPGYEDTLKKFGQFERNIMRNQHRVEIIKKNLQVSKKINCDKLIKVREMNENHS